MSPSLSKIVPSSVRLQQLRYSSNGLTLSILVPDLLQLSNGSNKRMKSSMSDNYMYHVQGNNDRMMHKSPRLSHCKIDTKSKAYIESMKKTTKQVQELNTRLALVRKGGGEKAVQKHLSRNKMLPRERIDMLIDPGTPFMELSPLAGMYSYADDTDETGQMNVPSAAIVTGIGIVAGVKIMIVANDATVKGVSSLIIIYDVIFFEFCHLHSIFLF